MTGAVTVKRGNFRFSCMSVSIHICTMVFNSARLNRVNTVFHREEYSILRLAWYGGLARYLIVWTERGLSKGF